MKTHSQTHSDETTREVKRIRELTYTNFEKEVRKEQDAKNLIESKN